MNAVLFDLGGVVLQWEPRRAYEQVLAPGLVADFMERIDFAAWNRSHDAGQLFADGERRLIEVFPDDEATVLAYRQQFTHTLTGMVPGTGAVIAELAQAGVRLVALTNWSAETFPYAEQRFGLLKRFDAIVVSGQEGLAKPDPQIFALALRRHGLTAAETVFVDDSPANVRAAESLGLAGVRFTDAAQLRARLVELGLLAPARALTEPVFHVAERAAWAAAGRTGRYPWSSRGLSYETQGFVHCSFATQLPGVLQARFADLSPLDRVILRLRDGQPVVVEDLGQGSFPHLYAELGPAGVVAEFELVPDPLGEDLDDGRRSGEVR